jgi:hypothetical protein
MFGSFDIDVFLQYYQFTLFAMSLNEMEEGMRSKLCPTDCRWGILLWNSQLNSLHNSNTAFDYVLTLLLQTSSRYSKAGRGWHRWSCCRENSSWRKAEGCTKGTQGKEGPWLDTKVYSCIYAYVGGHVHLPVSFISSNTILMNCLRKFVSQVYFESVRQV